MNKNIFSKVLLSASLSAVLLVAGCASSGSSSSRVVADPRLTGGDTAQFFSKSGFQACAAGAAVGVVGCALSNSGNKAACAVAAGLLACGVAMGANYYYDDRRSKYSNATQRLQAMTADVQADTQKVALRTAAVQSVIQEDKRNIAALDAAIKSNTADHAQTSQELARIDKNIELLNKDLKNMNETVKQYREVASAERGSGTSSADMAQLNAEISKLEKQVAAYNSEVNELYSQRSGINLGPVKPA